MSEYQCYEFMTVDKPLTRTQLDAVNGLSSHIEASSTHAIIEYHWGSFKHNPIDVLHKYFDGFLYWANWSSPRLAFRFPHGVFPATLIEGYDFDEHVTFKQHKDYDILDMHFGEMEPPDLLVEYELGSLIPLREELMEGDIRGLYIAWLAAQSLIEGTYGYKDEEDEEDVEDHEGDEVEQDEATRYALPVPPAFNTLTVAQQSLAELLQVPQELLVAVAQHSSAAILTSNDHFSAWVELLPENRRTDYLIRLARNEPGLNRLLVKELRELGGGKQQQPPTGERVSYTTLLTESTVVKERQERERREQERQERLRRLQDLHNHQDTYWRKAESDAQRGTSAGYDDATTLLVDLRDAAAHFKESQQFEERFRTWLRSHLRRPALVKRLQNRGFPTSGV